MPLPQTCPGQTPHRTGAPSPRRPFQLLPSQDTQILPSQHTNPLSTGAKRIHGERGVERLSPMKEEQENLSTIKSV